MKFTKLEIAKLLSKTPNVMAGGSEIVQFFHSPDFHPDEENEGNIVEDFMTFRGQLDTDMIDSKYFSISDTFLKDKPFTVTKVPKKIQKQMDIEWEEMLEYIKNYNELDSLKNIKL